MIVDVVAPHGRTILAAAAAALVAVAGWILANSQSEAARARSWDAYLGAMAAAGSGEPADAAFEEVTRRHPGTAAADWSRLRMAEIRLANGTTSAFRDRAAAGRDFQTAADMLSELLATRPRGLLAEQATFALAKAREGLGEFDQARKGYEAVAREHPLGPTAAAARNRAEALAGGSTRAWYDWWSQQDLAVASTTAEASVATPSQEESATADESDSKPAQKPEEGGGPAAADPSPAESSQTPPAAPPKP